MYYYDVEKSAKRIRNLRTDKGLAQSEAAEQMGFSLSGYRKLEQGKNGGSVDSLLWRLCRVQKYVKKNKSSFF